MRVLEGLAVGQSAQSVGGAVVMDGEFPQLALGTDIPVECSSEGSRYGVPVPAEGFRVGHAGLDAARSRPVPGTTQIRDAGLRRVDLEVGRGKVVADAQEPGGVPPSALLEGGVGFDLDDELGQT